MKRIFLCGLPELNWISACELQAVLSAFLPSPPFIVPTIPSTRHNTTQHNTTPTPLTPFLPNILVSLSFQFWSFVSHTLFLSAPCFAPKFNDPIILLLPIPLIYWAHGTQFSMRLHFLNKIWHLLLPCQVRLTRKKWMSQFQFKVIIIKSGILIIGSSNTPCACVWIPEKMPTNSGT